VLVHLDGAPAKSLGIQSIVPTPVAAGSDSGGTFFIFALAPGATGRMMITRSRTKWARSAADRRRWPLPSHQPDRVALIMDVVIRAAIICFVLLFVSRATSRCVLRPATPLAVVLAFVFGGIGVQAMMDEDRSTNAMLISLSTFSLLHVGISAAKRRWSRVGLVAEGGPAIVFRDGNWDDESLHTLHMARRDVVTEVRQNGMRSMDEVELVVAEHNGRISIIGKS
jgi:hypothetical protein